MILLALHTETTGAGNGALGLVFVIFIIFMLLGRK